jgi:FkbM family methyltransferase
MSERSQFSYHAVDLPGGVAADLALPEASSDPVVQAYAAGSSLNRYLVDLLVEFTQPGDRVLDLGCHVGTFSVPAAALGRRVIAVDASPLHVESVRLAAQRNRFESLLRVEWCAVDRAAGHVDFDENGLWGMVSRSTEPAAGRLRVAPRRADEIVAAAGWDAVDLVKMDVEGSELAAVDSLGALLESPTAPMLIYESNGMTFELFGYTIEDMRRRLEQLGYVTCRFEAGCLVYSDPSELQPEAWLDVIALPPAWQRKLAARISAWTPDAMVARCLEWGNNEHRNVREYLHRALESGARFPRDDSRIASLRAALAREFAAQA